MGVMPGAQGRERARGGFGSRPAARLEVIDAVTRIDREAAGWVRKLGHDDPGSTKRVLSLLAGLLPGVDARNRHLLEDDVRRWWCAARVLSGWDAENWRPDNTCPLCGHRGALRVRLVERVAICAECGSTWVPSTIGLLADHIRAENADAS